MGPGARRQAPLVAGGWPFLADPAQRADAQGVFWLAEVHASTVILVASPDSHPEAIVFTPATWPGDVVSRPGFGGLHVLVRAGVTRHRLWLPQVLGEGTPLAASVPLDSLAPARSEAAMKFWRHVQAGRLPVIPAVPARRHERSLSVLRALDGHLAGASYRAVAEALYGPTRVAAEVWKTSSVRDVTIRLVRSGRVLMRGGYRKLLKRGR